MKKLFLSTILFLTGFASLDAAYTPAAGPMPLADRGQTFNGRGAIMEELIKNQNNPGINAAYVAIAAFERRPNLRPYQEIMTSLTTSTETALAIDALKGFETVIMHLYCYRAYLHWNYDEIASLFVTGIRASWCDPRCYAPKSWISDNDPELKQLIDELDQVASIMYRHSPYESIRLKTMVHSYRHWRRNLALSCAAYLMFDIHNHGYDQSIIKQFGDRGLCNTPGIMANNASNLGHGIKYGYKGTKFVAENYWKYAVKPVGKFVLGGWNYAFGSAPKDPVDEKKKIISPAKPNVVQVEIQSITPKVEQPKPSNPEIPKNKPEEDPLAYLTAPWPTPIDKELEKIEKSISQDLQPTVVKIDKKFIDKADVLSSLVQNSIHQGIQDDVQENYEALKEFAAECRAYVMQQEYEQSKPTELVDNVSLVDNVPLSTELIQEIAKDHNLKYEPESVINKEIDPYYVQHPLIDFEMLSPKEWATLIGSSLLAAGVGYALA